MLQYLHHHPSPPECHSMQGARTRSMESPKVCPSLRIDTSQLSHDSVTVSCLVPHPRPWHHTRLHPRGQGPYQCLFLSTLFISNLFELFFHQKISHTYPPPPERHSIPGERTRSVESLSGCHRIGRLHVVCAHEEISHPAVPQSFQHFTPRSFPCSVFCPLFLFQICLNYFFTKKYPIPTPHPERHSMQGARTRSMESPKVCPSLRIDTSQLSHDSVTVSCLVPHPRPWHHTRLHPRGQGPYQCLFLSTLFISNLFELFFHQKISHTYPPPPERHSIPGERTRSVESLSGCHRIGRLHVVCAHEEISHPAVPQSFQHFTPRSFPCSVFCPLFLFQICLNYFFTKKYPIPTPHPERHSMQGARTRSMESPKVCPSLRIDTSQLSHDSVTVSCLVPHPRPWHHTRLHPRGQGPYQCLFLSTLFISNLFELFFHQKISHTYPPPPERHSIPGARTRSVKSLSGCHRIGRLQVVCAHEEISHPTVPQSFQHFTPRSFPYSVFCPLFLFQICLNYFFTKKYCIPPCFPNRSIISYQGYSPALFFVVPNYFKFV
jgi:hypothetical protein